MSGRFHETTTGSAISHITTQTERGPKLATFHHLWIITRTPTDIWTLTVPQRFCSYPLRLFTSGVNGWVDITKALRTRM